MKESDRPTFSCGRGFIPKPCVRRSHWAGQIIRSRVIPDGKKERLGLEEAARAHELLSNDSVTGRIMFVMG